jgi:NADH-quinone oxidoreductase subunit F/NADP-reducing hydrogenase subunit HndC
MSETGYRVHICHGPKCTPRGGARWLVRALETEVKRLGIEDRVEILVTSCRNRCELGPSVNVYPGPVCYGHVTPEAMIRIAHDHLLRGERVSDLVVAEAAARSIDLDTLDKLFPE